MTPIESTGEKLTERQRIVAWIRKAQHEVQRWNQQLAEAMAALAKHDEEATK